MIEKKDVKHVAKLARLELSEDETERFSAQLGNILEYFNELNEVNTQNVEPMDHPFPNFNVMREDEVVYKQTRDELLQNAPEEEDNYFKVPKINEE